MNELTVSYNSSLINRLSLINQAAKDNYKSQCKHWMTWLQNTGRGIDRDSIYDYFEHLDHTDYNAATVRNKRQAVKKRVRQLFGDMGTDFKMRIEAELKEIDQEIKAPKINTDQVTADRVLSKQEYRDILLKCRSDRQRAFIMFLYATGCRVNELTGTALSDCESQKAFYLIRVMGKGKKERRVRIETDLYNFINQTFNGKKYLFETGPGKRYQNDYISKQIATCGRRIGRKISAHSLRHSFATNMIKTYPAQIQAVSKYMGHSDVSITLSMYVHTELSNDELFSLIH